MSKAHNHRYKIVRNCSCGPWDKTSFDMTAPRRVGFAWPVAIWQTIVRAHAWRKCYHERRKSEEDAGMHAYTGGTGWRGRVNAVRPCHVATTYALCETSSPRRRSRNERTEGGRRKQRESPRIGICAIPIVSARNQTRREWISPTGDVETFYQI